MGRFEKCFVKQLSLTHFTRTETRPHHPVIRKVREQNARALLNTEETGEPFHDLPNTLPDSTLDEFV